MRVLILATRYFGLGGAELYQRQFAETCARLGHRVVVASLHDGDLDPKDRTLPWTTLDNGARVAQYIDYRGSKTDFLYSAWKWRRTYDLVVAGHVSLAPVAWAMRRPYIAIGYGIDVWDRLSPLRRHAVSHAKKVVCISAFTAWMMYRENGIVPPQVAVIHPAVDDALLVKGQASVGAPRHEPFTLLTVARLDSRERYKGHDLAIKAMAAAAKATDRTMRYVVVGGGDDRPRLQALALGASRLRMGGPGGLEFDFHGHVPHGELSVLYSDCDLFVMPSICERRKTGWAGEGFGIVHLEAACFGKPSIAGAGGAEEAVLDGITGYCTEGQINYDLAGKIVELATNDEKRIEMGRKARQFVDMHFTMARFTREVGVLLRDCLSPASNPSASNPGGPATSSPGGSRIASRSAP